VAQDHADQVRAWGASPVASDDPESAVSEMLELLRSDNQEAGEIETRLD
jgi:hypothetical protein